MKSAISIEAFVDKIGSRIRDLRKQQGMTQLDLATYSNIDVRQVQRLERGHTSATLKTLYKIANGLNVEFIALFDFSKDS